MLRPTLIRTVRRAGQQMSTASKCLPEFTKDRYPQIKRGEFATLNETHFNFFARLLGANRVLRDPSDCEAYNVDWVRNVRGFSSCVLKPKTTHDVSEILHYCHAHNLAVCPQGGNTGLVGGSVPVFDEVVLSTGFMNEIINLDEVSGVLVCQAGCILENLDNFLSGKGLMVPLDLAAKASCQIGGNVATNAGGLRLLRYGSMQGNVLGLEIVKANGEILELLSTLKKDNTGIHLKNLFIGSEGTLGIITKVAIQCPPKPKAVHVAFLGTNSFENVLEIFKKAKYNLGEILSSFELIDAESLKLVVKYFNKTSPIEQKFPFYVLLETHGSSESSDEEKLNEFLSSALESFIVLDGTVTNEPSKIKNIWELRESITSALLHDGYVYKYDFSVPISNFYSIVEVMRERLGNEAVTVCGYGHIGDCNVHLNITTKEYTEATHKRIEPFVYQYIAGLRGSVSAEHGIGFRKAKYLQYSKSDSAIRVMKQIKSVLDPKGILNPYKVF